MNQPLIAEAFSRTAAKYDAFASDHPHLTYLRQKVYAHLKRHVPQGARILELNGGSGTDAVALAQQGYRIHLTDIAPGMLERARHKVRELNLAERITIEERSFLSLTNLAQPPFDAIFSNLGGLNCLPDLSPVIAQLPQVLRPNGTITWVLMPKVCLWELAEILRGNFRLATRRWQRGGTRSHLEGLHFDVYYFTPNQVRRWFGTAYQLIALEGLAVFTPTAESKNFAKNFPRLYQRLVKTDDVLSPHAPFNSWGDFFIITMRYAPPPPK